MANKQALRDLQSRLAERLQAARTEPVAKSWLAVECGSRGFLFPLKEAGEIFALAPMVPVPHSHRWFLGVSNLRGHLHGVVDLAGFLGLKTGERPSFVGGRYRDASSRVWQELNLVELAGNDLFLKIVG